MLDTATADSAAKEGEAVPDAGGVPAQTVQKSRP